MALDAGDEESATLSPGEAFAILGNETRMGVLRALGEADGPLSFSELRTAVGYDTASNFSYHLEKLLDHFVRRTDEGYELRKPGRNVVEAVLAGAVTEDPVVGPAEIDERCYYCDSPIVVDYRRERVGIFCTGCDGNFDVDRETLAERFGSEELAATLGLKGASPLPPAGVVGRSPAEMHRAATTRIHLDMLSTGANICPACSAPLDHSVIVCETHDGADGVCDACGRRQAVVSRFECTNCIHTTEMLCSLPLFATTEMLHFATHHGLNPIAPESPETFWGHFTPYEEEVRSVDPFEARFRFEIDGDSIAFIVDERLNVVDVE